MIWIFAGIVWVGIGLLLYRLLKWLFLRAVVLHDWKNDSAAVAVFSFMWPLWIAPLLLAAVCGVWIFGLMAIATVVAIIVQGHRRWRASRLATNTTRKEDDG